MKDDPKIFGLLSSMIDEQKQTNTHLAGIEEQVKITNGRLSAIEFQTTQEHEEIRKRIVRVEGVLTQHGLLPLR